jgi:O-antigen/teichoic acid export membrane protein
MRRLAQRSGWTLGNTVVVTLAVFAETIILARYLGPSAFGVFLLIVVFPEAILQVLDIGGKDAMNKYLSEYLETGQKAKAAALVKLLWLLDIGVGVFCLLLVIVLSPYAAEILTGDRDDGRLMALFAFGLFLGTLDTASGTVLRVLDRFRLSFILGSIGMAARVALIIVAVAAGGDLEAIVWARNGGELAMTLALGGASLMLLKPLLWEHRRTPMAALGERRREILRFLLNTNLTSTLKTASTKFDTMLIGVFGTPAAVAVYKLALQFGRAPAIISDSLFISVFPTMARAAARGDYKEIRQVVRSSTILIGLTVVPASLLVLPFGDDIMRLAGGDGFTGGGLTFALCVLATLPWVIFFWLRPLILTTGHPAALLRAQAAGTVVQLVGILALVPSQGAEGAAIALLVANVVIVGMWLAFSRRRRLLAGDSAPDPGPDPLHA